MKTVFVASEAAPYIKTGGLGDVARDLPAALAKYVGNEVFVFIPYYKKIKENKSFPIEFVTSFSVDLSWRKQHVGIFKLKSRARKLNIYFIDNEYYFGKDGCYGYYDDGEKFAYFSKAVLEACLKLSIYPDIIHCNDWQTALVPIFLRAFYQDTLGKAKTVFTIHNIEYQGKADGYFLSDTLGLPSSYEDTLSYDGQVNFMKGAILTTDALTTVSKTYAEEIKYPYYAHGLAPIICEHSFKLCGIVNGIDPNTCDPMTDKAIVSNYDIKSFKKGKAENKKALQKELSLEIRDDVPIIGMVSRIVSHKGADLLCSAIYELMNWDVQIVILGTGDRCYEEVLKNCSDANRGKLSVNLCFDSALASRIYASSDIYLMPSKSEPCGLSQLIAMRYGAIPVVNSTGGLRDTVEPFDRESQSGVGFTFQSFNKDDMLGALRRALEIYGGDRKMWEKAVANAMSYDSSWDRQTAEYMELYNRITGRA